MLTRAIIICIGIGRLSAVMQQGGMVDKNHDLKKKIKKIGFI
jgi:hypothetical protein